MKKIAKSLVFALTDRKRKVRQAVLELLAILAQLTSISLLLDVVTAETEEHPEQERIIRVLRNRFVKRILLSCFILCIILRLSRRQLPIVEPNGLIRYSTPIGESELEWLSLGNNGLSSGQNYPNSESRQRINSSSNSDLGFWQRDDRFKRGRRGLEIHSASDVNWSRYSNNYKVNITLTIPN